MNKLRITSLGLMATLACFGQLNTVVATTLSAAVTQTQNTVTVASATGINAPASGVPGSSLWVVDRGQPMGELMSVISVSSTTVTVSRTRGKTTAHASGAMVLIATAPNWFQTTDPNGSCVTASTFVTPWVNITNGRQWLCSAKTLTWIPGWGNLSATAQVSAASATASVAGATAINSPFLHISGTNAITSFTMGVGWNGNGFCVHPDAAFTGTATNNIGKAFTAVADRVLCFAWDATSSVFIPSY